MPDKKPTQHFDDPAKKLPKRRKGYRKLMVDDQMFQWRVYDGGRVVLIAPDDSRSSFVLSNHSSIGDDEDEGSWWDEDYQRSITPQDIVPHAKAMLRAKA